MTPQSGRFVQVAFCTSNLPRSIELYSRALGFDDAGGQAFTGKLLARVQGLGDSAATVVWWLVGPQEFFQVELFAHTEPQQRNLPDGWRPSDLGWVRWGVAVADLDAVVVGLANCGIELITEPLVELDCRRVCFRDPWTKVIVEVIERGDADPCPAVIYGTVSVPDLDRARAFYIEAVGLAEYVGPALHGPEHETLWGLPGAKSSSFVVDGGGILLEVVRYDDPVGRPMPADYRLSDQGFMHMAVGVRDMGDLKVIAARIESYGYRLTNPLQPGSSGGTYVVDGDDLTLEIIAVPVEFESQYGFLAQAPPIFGDLA